MPSIEDKLFLIDFVVNSIDLSILPYEANKQDESCISFEFMNNAPVTLYEDEFKPKSKNCVKGGKSVLFPMSPEIEAWAMTDFQIIVTVFKIVGKSDKIPVGYCNISISTLFRQISTDLAENGNAYPTSKSVKDSYRLVNPTGGFSGTAAIYLRLSCIGRTIVTEFRIGSDATFLFREACRFDSAQEFIAVRSSGNVGKEVEKRDSEFDKELLCTMSDIGHATEDVPLLEEEALKVINQVQSAEDSVCEFELMVTQSEMQPSDYQKSNQIGQLAKLRHLSRIKSNDITAIQHQRLIERYRVNRFPKNLELILSEDLKKNCLLKQLDSVEGLSAAISNKAPYTEKITEPFHIYQEYRNQMSNEESQSSSEDEELETRMRPSRDPMSSPSYQDFILGGLRAQRAEIMKGTILNNEGIKVKNTQKKPAQFKKIVPNFHKPILKKSPPVEQFQKQFAEFDQLNETVAKRVTIDSKRANQLVGRSCGNAKNTNHLVNTYNKSTNLNNKISNQNRNTNQKPGNNSNKASNSKRKYNVGQNPNNKKSNTGKKSNSLSVKKSNASSVQTKTTKKKH